MGQLKLAETSLYQTRAALNEAAWKLSDEGVELPELGEAEQLLQALLERVRGLRRETTSAVESTPMAVAS